MKINNLDLSRLMMFRTPRITHFGLGARNELVNEAKQLCLSKILIVSDKNLETAGVVQQVSNVLDNANISYEINLDAQPEPTDIVASKVIETGRSSNFDGVIGIGGGSNMDLAKLAAALQNNPGPLNQFYGTDLIPKNGLPLILMPTTAGTGSEATDVSVITDSKTSSKNAIFSRHLLADVAIIDPELTLSCPKMVTASSGMDALSHAIEARWSLIGHELTSWLAIEAIRRIGRSLREAVHNGTNIEARAEMAYAAYVAAMAFATAGVSSVHAAAYPLGVRYHLPHGLSNALMLPAIMEFNAESIPEDLAIDAMALGIEREGRSDYELALEGAKAVKQLAIDIGIPAGLSKLKEPISESELPVMANDMSKITRLLTRNPRKIGEAEALEIYKKAL